MRKGIITLGAIAIVVLVTLSLGPVVVNLLTDKGLRTASISEGGEPASVGVDGAWEITKGRGANTTQAGYTFDEKLPSGSKTTSGRTDKLKDEGNVVGDFLVKNGTMTEGLVSVNVASISSDVEKRDINVRQHVLHTDDYPNATFSLTKPVDVSQIPDDGSVAKVKVTGELKLMAKTREVSTELEVLRTGKNVIVAGNIPFKRADFGIETPDFIASSIAPEGTIDLLLVLEQKK